MNKSNTKVKLTLVQNAKKKKIAAPPDRLVNAASSQTLEQLATVDFWEKEIANIKSDSFASVGQATEKLIDQVLLRLELKDEGQGDVREFLRLVFESSEVLHNSLKKSLKLN